MAFFFDWQTFFHAGYVAFVFAVLFFGALAFRQIVDNLEVKRLQLGEDRDSFLQAPTILLLGGAWSVVLVVGPFLYVNISPTVYSYALPLILSVQLLQLTMRAFFQRTQVKTRGLVVRSLMFDKVRGLPFSDIVMIRFVQDRFWVDVRIGLKNEEAGFRIFSFSAASLERMLEASCSAPILWASKESERPNERL